jgi:hypothetical protein
VAAVAPAVACAAAENDPRLRSPFVIAFFAFKKRRTVSCHVSRMCRDLPFLGAPIAAKQPTSVTGLIRFGLLLLLPPINSASRLLSLTAVQ